MQKIHAEKILVRTCACDFTGKWRLSAILEAMQEAAGDHAEILHCGWTQLYPQNIAWILNRSQVEMDRYPGVGEYVTVKTFPMPNRRMFFPRYFLFEDENGGLYGKASTVWALLNLKERRMAPPDIVLPCIPDNSDLTPPLPLPGVVDTLTGPETVSTYSPVYTDLDVNGHVNNTKYADWACNLLGVDVLRENDVSSLTVNYQAELRPGQEISLHLTREGNRFRMAGYHEDRLHIDLGGVLSPRQ